MVDKSHEHLYKSKLSLINRMRFDKIATTFIARMSPTTITLA